VHPTHLLDAALSDGNGTAGYVVEGDGKRLTAFVYRHPLD
jgi:hypothetical protein